MASALQRRGYHVARQVPVPIVFDGVAVEIAFRVDILVEGSLILEIKCVEQLAKVHAKHLLTYLRLMKQPLGLLLNFSGETMKEGILGWSTTISRWRDPFAFLACFARTDFRSLRWKTACST